MTEMKLMLNGGDVVIAAFPWHDHVMVITQAGHIWRIDAWEELGMGTTDLQAQQLR